MEFLNSWLWLIFIVGGLLMVLLELVIGVETALDLAILGTVFIIGGAATACFKSWLPTLIVTGIISALYIGIGRKYVQNKLKSSKEEKTNIDTIIDQRGIVQQRITKDEIGFVKVGNEVWRARANKDIEAGEEIEVIGVKGITLEVKRL